MNDFSDQKPAFKDEFAGQWWANLFEASVEAKMVCRADGTAVHINKQARRLFKLKIDLDRESFSVFKLLPSTAIRKVGWVLQQRPSYTEKLHSVLLLHEGCPQSLMDLEMVALQGGFALIVFRDSGHRLRLESHIQRLITAIDATPDVFLVTDADLRITFVNPAFQTATGYSLEEVLGRSDEFLRAPFELAKVNAYRERVSQGREWIGEFVNQRRNGENYHVESTISPISDIAGRFMGYVVSERDITMRLRLQEELRAERDFAQSILQSLDMAVYTLDPVFRITHANEGWRHFSTEHGGLRLNGAPQIGKSLLDYVPDPARRVELMTAFTEVVNTGKAQDHHYHASDGQHWLVKISPWINASQTRGLICNISDQTRHYELQNQLFQSQKMEIIGTLAAGVAHDFNNLLQVIRGHTSLALMQAPEGTPLRHGLQRVDMAAIRAAEITQQLLSFSRVSDERRMVLDLNKVIKEANHLAKRTLRGNVTVELNPTAKPIRVKIDPTKASQALVNLCVNAQDAMPDGGRLTLTNVIVEPTTEQIASHNLPAGVSYARCSVGDTGCGIPSHILPRIFEPFFTTKENGKGTGLGLPIVKRVAEEAGGFIEVESAPGSGTTFHLYLPLVAEQLAPVPPQVEVKLAHGKGRVLVVDDVDLLRDFTQKFLQMTGLKVLVASSGQQALKVLEESVEPVDLVFTDYNMPNMTGLELIEAISKRWPRTKFILASGFLDDETYARIEQCQASILAKPYDMHDAAKMVTEKLAEKSEVATLTKAAA